MSQLDMILGQTGNNPLPISVASNNILQVKIQKMIIILIAVQFLVNKIFDFITILVKKN